MDENTLRTKAQDFERLHHGPDILMLPNCWDVASAVILGEAGFPAIATTSAGIAFSRGYPDGHYISREEMCGEVRRCADAVGVPMSADMEGGYGTSPEDVVQTVVQTMAAGAVGANIEDGVRDPRAPLLDITLGAERIRAGREAADAAGIPFVINARTDVYMHGDDRPSQRFDEAVRRANAYFEAGARALFVPMVSDRDTIARLVEAIDGPLNILAGPSTPPLAELHSLGVARVSIGGSLMRACLKLTERAAAELRGSGTFGYAADAFSNAELNRRLAR